MSKDIQINYEDYYIWHEREVRFDISKKEISLRKGEKCLDTISNIEDSKGNNGDVGCIMFTNLRIVWFCVENLKLNLSIGYDCVLASDVKPINSKVSGESMALYIKVKFGNNRFEFVFNAVGNSSPQLFNTFTYVIRLYEHTRLYRDIKQKGHIVFEKTLINLSLEEVFFGVKNSSLILYNKGEETIYNAGEFLVTNIRIVWFTPSNDVINISIPWIDIRLLKLKSHQKYGEILCVESNKYFNSQLFCFKLHLSDVDMLEKIYEQMKEKYIFYLDNPILGIYVDRDESGKIINKIETNEINKDREKEKEKQVPNLNVNQNNKENKLTIQTAQEGGKKIREEKEVERKINEKNERVYGKLMNEFPDDVEIIQTNFFNEQAILESYIRSKNDKVINKNDIMYSQELGLSIERIPDNQTVEKIWKYEV